MVPKAASVPSVSQYGQLGRTTGAALPWKSLLPQGVLGERRGDKGLANCSRTQTFTIPRQSQPYFPDDRAVAFCTHKVRLPHTDAAEAESSSPTPSPEGTVMLGPAAALASTSGAAAAAEPGPSAQDPQRWHQQVCGTIQAAAKPQKPF